MAKDKKIKENNSPYKGKENGGHKSKMIIHSLKEKALTSEEGKKLLEDFENDEPVLLLNKEDLQNIPLEQKNSLFIEEVTNVVLDELLKGKQRNEIYNKLVKEYKFKSFRSVKNYIERASQILKEMMIADRTNIKERHQALLMKLFQMNIDRDDLREARTCLEVLNKMFGLNEATKLDISGNLIEFKFKTAALPMPAEDVNYTEIKNEKLLDKKIEDDLELPFNPAITDDE